ncbi:MAG: response regulator [Clostridia bacterium]|nr:response regulator [Clostridia bacterium]
MYRILLVDDNYIHLQSLLSYIEPEEFNISGIKICQSGHEALEICREFKPHVVITDISMPEMDGMELTQKIRKIEPDTQFIYISCYDDVSYFKNAIENEVLAYLMKPIIPEELHKALHKAIAKAKKVVETANGLQVSRENFVYRLLFSKDMGSPYLADTAASLSLKNYNNFILVKSRFLDHDNGAITAFQEINHFQCIAKKRIVPIILPEDAQSVMILFMSEISDNFSETVRSIIQRKTKEIFDSYAVSVISGASDTGTNLFELKALLMQAEAALSTNQGLLNSEYISYSEIALKTSEFQFAAYHDAVCALLRPDITAEEVNRFITQQFEGNSVEYDENLLRELYLSTMSATQSILLKYGIDMSYILGKKDFSQHKVNRFADMEQFLMWLKNLLLLTGEYLKNYKGKPQFALVEKTISYIHQNYPTISSIEEIASKLFVSYSHLRNVFKKELGITIYDYLLSVRMEAAKKLLTTTQMNLTQIAYKVGYSDYDYFKTVFTKYNGISPREYQQTGN